MRESRAIDLQARVASDLPAVKPTNKEEEKAPEEYGLALIVEAEAGFDEGLAVGAAVVGFDEGLAVGAAVVGFDEGLAVGAAVVGFDKGLAVGAVVVGFDEGLAVGAAVVGFDEGLAVGAAVVGFDKTKPVRPPFADDSDTADKSTELNLRTKQLCLQI
jgi:phosphohistidine swiveling domain-containing protein